MRENASGSNVKGYTPLMQLIIAFFIISVAGMTLFYLSLMAGGMIFGISPGEIGNAVRDSSGSENTGLAHYLIAIQQLTMFLIPAIVIRWYLGSSPGLLDCSSLKTPAYIYIMVAILSVFIIPVTIWSGWLNSRLDLPEWLSGIEQWIRLKEKEAADLTSLLTESSNFSQLLISLAIMAFLPSLCEEFLFRGILQPLFGNFLRSPIAGIWVTAILFSAIHFQFYGFLPRMILGLVFGYLYFWSGNIMVPVTAHLANNSAVLIIDYLVPGKYQVPESPATFISGTPIVSIILAVLLISILRVQLRKHGIVADRH